jgi:tRNA(fMet)-specific endonuclease VapC
MTDFLLDTDTASRLMRADRATVKAMRTASATSISVSAVTQSELLYGARLHADKPDVMAAVRSFLIRVTVHPWDGDAAELHAKLRADVKAAGRSAGAFDLMIAAHARALGHTLVTSDKAIANLKVDGLRLANWKKAL